MKALKKTLCTIIVCSFALSIFGQGTWTCYTEKDALNLKRKNFKGVIRNVNGATWFLTTKGIHVFDGKEWSIIDENNHLIQSEISTFLLDSKNRIWIGTRGPVFWDGWGAARLYNGGVSIYDIDNNKWEYITKEEIKIPAPHVNKIYETSNGDVWITLSSTTDIRDNTFLHAGGLVQYVNGKFISHKDDLPDPKYRFVSGIFEDKNGRVWFWTRTGIIFFYKNGTFQVPSENDGYKQIGIPTAVYYDLEKNLWFGSDGNIIMWDGEQWHYYGKKNGLKKGTNYIRKFREMNDGRMTFIARLGLYVFDGQSNWEVYKFKKTSYMKTKDIVTAYTVEDEAGNLILYNNQNFGVFDGNTIRIEKKRLHKMTYDRTEDVLWISTDEGIEYRKDGKWIKNSKIKDAWSFLKDKSGSTWVFTLKSGIYVYSEGNWLNYNEGNSLPSNNIKMVFADHNGAIWVGTDMGTCKFE